MKSNLFDCMHLGEHLLGAIALLALLIIAGSITVLLIGQLRSGRSSRKVRTVIPNVETDHTN